MPSDPYERCPTCGHEQLRLAIPEQGRPPGDGDSIRDLLGLRYLDERDTLVIESHRDGEFLCQARPPGTGNFRVLLCRDKDDEHAARFRKELTEEPR